MGKESTTVNLYDVLNLENDCTRKDVKTAYRELAKIFHPDRKGGDAEMFELVTHSYNVLANQKTRKEYDNLYKLSKESTSDHFNLKQRYDDHLDVEKSGAVKKSKKEMESEFNKVYEDMDRKHKYKRDIDDKAIDGKDFSLMAKDLKLAREQEDIENIHEKIFEDGRFDLGQFNAAFDSMNTGSSDIVPHEGAPLAWNTVGNVSGNNFSNASGNNFDSNFSTIENYEDIYLETGSGDENDLPGLYGSAKFDKNNNKKLNVNDVRNLKGADYTDNHNVIEEDFTKSIEQRMRERESETQKFSDRDMDQFDTDPSCGGFGIFDGVGMGNLSKITWDNDDDMQTRYNRLLEMRKDTKNN